jgi:hypothetical protein
MQVTLWKSMFLVALCLWNFLKVRLTIIFSGVLIKVQLNIASLIALFSGTMKAYTPG